jgi:hypothetical protein
MNSNGSTPKILIEARELICRQPPFQSDELHLILAASEHISRSEPISHTDSRILRAADRLAPFYAPRPPTPFDERIEEALVEEAEKQVLFEEATEVRNERVLDFASLTGSGSVMLTGRNGRPVTIWTTSLEGRQSSDSPNRRHVDKAFSAAQAAQEALGLAEESFKRSRVAKNEILHARGRWRAVAGVAK